MSQQPDAVRVVSQRVEHRFDLRAYSLSAIKRAAYRLANRCTVAFSDVSDDALTVVLVASAGEDAEHCLRLLLSHAIDEELRAEIAEKTAATRDLILAHAFSRTQLVAEPEA